MSGRRPMSLAPGDQLDLFGAAAPVEAERAMDAGAVLGRIERRLSRRARRLSISVHLDGRIVLTVPHRAPERDVRAFVDEQQRWIVETLAEQRARRPAGSDRMPQCLQLSAVGERWQLVRRVRAGRGLRASLRPGASAQQFVLRLDGDAGIDEAALKAATRAQLKHRARRYLEGVLPGLSAAMQCPFKRVQVRAQRSRWGSYSTSGTISMNYALLFLEPELARYLCVHELAHVRHLDHSPAFWSYVDRFASPARGLDERVAARNDILPGWLW